MVEPSRVTALLLRTSSSEAPAPALDRAPSGGRLRIMAVLAAGAALTVGARLPGPVGDRVANVALGFVSLVLEALPFLLAGALLAAALDGRTGTRLRQQAVRRPRLSAALAPLSGVGLPLCDCGLVPLARQLHRDGASGVVVNGFVTGAPLTNPIVIVSTFIAFPGQPGMVVGRVAVGIAVAMLVAAIAAGPTRAAADGDACHDGTCSPVGRKPGLLPRAGAELLEMAPTLVVGALLAAVIKAFIPLSVLVGFSEQPLLGAVALMGLAYVMSVCSQADAFVAASLPVGPLPQLAFMTLGPVFDLKLSALYRHTFGSRWVIGVGVVAVPAVLLLSTLWVAWSPL